MKYLLFPLCLAACLPAIATSTATLAIDQSHSAVVFSWNHVGMSNPVARFEKLEGTVVLDTGDITKSSVSVTIPVDGLRTGVELLDRRLKGDEFFAAAKYPKITFRSTSVIKGSMDTLRVTGDLTVHGITKPVVLDVKVNGTRLAPASDPGMAGFEADTTLRRTDYDLDRYVPSVSDEIHVHMTLETYQKP